MLKTYLETDNVRLPNFAQHFTTEVSLPRFAVTDHAATGADDGSVRLWDTGDPASRYATINSSDTCDGAPNSSIWLLDDDGRVDIEQPGRFRSPISLSNFLLGFGAFVVLIAVFGRSREM